MALGKTSVRRAAAAAGLLCTGLLACDSNGGARAPGGETVVLQQGRARVLHERDFVQDPALRLRPADTGVFRLEGGDHARPDTGSTGVDLVPLAIEDAARHTFCVGEGDPTGVEVLDEDDRALGSVSAGACGTFELAPGQYTLRLTSAAGDGGGRLAFLRPVDDPARPPRGREVPAPLQGERAGATYSVPAKYDDIPFGCTLKGPWLADELICHFAYCDMFPDIEGCSTNAYDLGGCFSDEFVYCYGDHYNIACDEDLAPTYDPGHMAEAWRTCFNGTGYTPATHDPIIQQAGNAWFQEWCGQMVVADCAAEWFQSPRRTPSCPGFKRLEYYGAVSLRQGEIAVIPQSRFWRGRTACPPDDYQYVAVMDASCANIGRRIGGVVLGPRTQAILYSGADYGGYPLLYENRGGSQQSFCLPMGAYNAHDPAATTPPLMALKRSTSPSVAVNVAAGLPSDACRVERAGLWCQASGSPSGAAAVYAAHADLNVLPPGPGEVLLVGKQELAVEGTSCGQALVVNTSCDDLSKLGFEDKAEGVLRPDADTFAVLFHDRNFAGKNTTVDAYYRYPGTSDPSRGQFQYLPDPTDGGHAGRDSASSVRAMRNADANRVTLITTGVCNECNLAGVDLSGEDLTNHRLVGADLSGASLDHAVLTGADLGGANLTGASLAFATLGGTHLGCARLAGIDTSAPSDPHRSTLTVLSAATWARDFTVEGARFQCTTTSLAGAKVPITLLPRDSWVALDLSNVTLLDLTDGYALDGLVLAGGSYPGLVAGNKALSMRGVRAAGAKLAGAVLSRVDFGLRDVAGTPTPSDFAGAVLSGANLTGTNLQGADLSGAWLDPLMATTGNLSASLAHAYLRDARLASAHLTSADLTGAYFYGTAATVANATLERASFANGVFSGVDFRECKLAGASFAGAQLVHARFDDPATDASDALFTDANLQGASFAGARIAGASFNRAHVSTASGCWGYVDPACDGIQVRFAATDLGTTTGANRCPSGDFGPCTGDKLIASGGTTAPIPACVPDVFGDGPDACMSYEVLTTGDVPSCTDTSDALMQCGCLQTVVCGG